LRRHNDKRRAFPLAVRFVTCLADPFSDLLGSLILPLFTARM